uniref:NADH dehydrogenase subunit 5 n=1 Tax=Brachidontes pharaonis TaxID=205971 RepID=UPI002036EA4E|nr:NADH dehydrogenase subunit 5 [Brachidontes pharaonis]URF22676.1 NADH dehydrogenase subunit 5 [Brachidontes pharaonis]
MYRFLLCGLSSAMNKLFFVSVGVGYLCLFSSLWLNKTILMDFCLVSLNCLSVNFCLMFDEVSLMFVGAVLVISGSVGIYSSWYMDDEKFFLRFMFLILLFVGSMVSLILIPNLICLMLGWDGLGLVSFLLVCYYQNNKSLSAAMVTAITNRVGDVLILVCVGMLSVYGDWVFYKRYDFCFSLFMSVMFVVAGMTKSAQIPFSAWLPAAMAAPTPVSSLVHSSTLVTAGVYLLIRGFWVLEPNSQSLDLLKIASLLTLLMAGMVALMEVDFKKVIALSTLSQLGVMMFCLSMKLPYVAFFHLITHATFKALLFVSAGCVIHSNSGNQDLRSLSKCWEELPVSMSFLSVASFSLAGVPFMSGFFSKDLIIELSLMSCDNFVIYVLMMVGVSFTSWYMLRVFMSVAVGNNKKAVISSWSKESSSVVVSYVCLFFCAVFSGWVISSKFKLVFFSTFIDTWLFLTICFIPLYGVFLFLFMVSLHPLPWLPRVSKFIISMWNFKLLSSQFLIMPGMLNCYKISRCMDQGWLEMVGPQGVYSVLSKSSQKNQLIQSWYFLFLLGSLLLCLSVSVMIVLFFLS